MPLGETHIAGTCGYEVFGVHAELHTYVYLHVLTCGIFGGLQSAEGGLERMCGRQNNG